MKWISNKPLKQYPTQYWKNSWYLLSDSQLDKELDKLFDNPKHLFELFVKETQYRQQFDLTPAPSNIKYIKLTADTIPDSYKNLPIFFKPKRYHQNNQVYLQAHKQLIKTKLKCRKCKGLNIVNPNLPLKLQTPVGISFSLFEPLLTVIGQSLHSYSLYTPKFQIPFKGNIPAKDSGFILYSLLQRAGFIERWNFTLTNIVACHPIGNQPNKPEWINNCYTIFETELNVNKPEILLVVGNSAKSQLYSLLSKQQIKTKKIHQSKYATVEELTEPLFGSVKLLITTYHPSYIQRKYGLQSKATIDYITDVSNTIKTVCLNYRYPYKTLQELLERIYPEGITFYDVNIHYSLDTT